MSRFNVYCDESCHLQNDGQKAMVLGAIWCPADHIKGIADELRELKRSFGLARDFELKWTKVSHGRLDYYQAAVGYFFQNQDLHFRGLVVPDKAILQHEVFLQDHGTWYYKMYFNLLKVILQPGHHYRVYVDLKDTRGASKVAKLHEVLCNNALDFSRDIIERIQLVRSHEVEILQLTDLLIGAVGYVHRGLNTSAAKGALIGRIRERSGYQLTKTTLLMEGKFNLLVWVPKAGGAAR